MSYNARLLRHLLQSVHLLEVVVAVLVGDAAAEGAVGRVGVELSAQPALLLLRPVALWPGTALTTLSALVRLEGLKLWKHKIRFWPKASLATY